LSSVAVAADAFSFDQLPPEPVGARGTGGAKDAQAVAEEVLAAARAQAEDILHEARQQGHQEGYAAGMAAAQEELAPAAQALAQVHSEIQARREELVDVVEERAVELALQIAEKVVAGTIEVQPERVVDVVRGALRCLVDRERVTVQVNTLDLELVRDSVASLSGTLGGIGHFEVQEERRVTRGGAIVVSGGGEVDASIETKLQRAREALEEELRR
jgi:flagellar assembly protein FliH